MIAPARSHSNRSKHGKDRNGHQRYKCRKCNATFVSDDNRPLGDMRLDLNKAVIVLGMLLEGMSIRACERLTGMMRDTICDLVLTVGEVLPTGIFLAGENLRGQSNFGVRGASTAPLILLSLRDTDDFPIRVVATEQVVCGKSSDCHPPHSHRAANGVERHCLRRW
jgi:transposase-like protein